MLLLKLPTAFFIRFSSIPFAIDTEQYHKTDVHYLSKSMYKCRTLIKCTILKLFHYKHDKLCPHGSLFVYGHITMLGQVQAFKFQ